MRFSKPLLISVFITAVILVMVGGITTMAMANKGGTQPAAAETIKGYQQREAAYKQLIQQANQQIEKANENMQQMQTQLASGQPSTEQNQTTAAASTALSADKADEIARQAAGLGQTSLKKPELVNFQGKTAFEIVFNKGTIYVDAQSGEVLFNGTVPQKISADEAARIAGDYLKDSEILQVDQITFRKAPIYRVTFKNGTMAFMDLTGQITYVQARESKTVVQQVSHSGNGNQGPAVVTSASNPGTVQPAQEPSHETEHESDNGN